MKSLKILWNWLYAWKIKKSISKEKFLMFQEMELCDSKIKKIFIFSQKEAFLIFLEMEPCTFQPMLKKKNKKKTRASYFFSKESFFQESLKFRKRKLRKNSLCLKKWNFSYISRKEYSEPREHNRNFLFVWNFQPYISLIFQEEVTFRAQKVKRTHSWKVSYISGNGIFLYLRREL